VLTEFGTRLTCDKDRPGCPYEEAWFFDSSEDSPIGTHSYPDLEAIGLKRFITAQFSQVPHKVNQNPTRSAPPSLEKPL